MMTEQEWRRVLRWEYGLHLVQISAVASFLMTIFAMAGLAAFDPSIRRGFAIALIISAGVWIVSGALLMRGLRMVAGDRVKTALACQRQHRERIAQERAQEKRRREDALAELVADTGLGLGERLWQRAERMKREDWEEEAHEPHPAEAA